jgi:hypothetical protein
MLPRQSVKPKNKEAYTAAPLQQNQEHGANTFDWGKDEDNYFVVPASIVVNATTASEGMTKNLSVGGG